MTSKESTTGHVLEKKNKNLEKWVCTQFALFSPKDLQYSMHAQLPGGDLRPEGDGTRSSCWVQFAILWSTYVAKCKCEEVTLTSFSYHIRLMVFALEMP